MQLQSIANLLFAFWGVAAAAGSCDGCIKVEASSRQYIDGIGG